jgi:hypothetical protein
MMGPLELRTIREEVRKAFHMPDKELREWFDRQVAAFGQGPKATSTEIKTLCLLRDALLKESRQRRTSRKRPLARGRSHRTSQP